MMRKKLIESKELQTAKSELLTTTSDSNEECYPPLKIITGQINGANYILAQQDTSTTSSSSTTTASKSNKLMIFAHGCRPKGLGLSCSEMNFDSKVDSFWKFLLLQNWTIGMTSYRRDGLIIRDAIDDIISLKQTAIEFMHGCELSVLVGESMGGCISTFISEMNYNSLQKPLLFDGIMTIGAALLASEPGLDFSFHAGIKILHLTTTDELTGVMEWTEKVNRNTTSSSIMAAVWYVKRNGHCNCNSFETIASFSSLIEWITMNQIKNMKDVTHEIIQESTCFWDDNGVWSRINSINLYGDVNTSFTPQDMLKLGIQHGQMFSISYQQQRIAGNDSNSNAIKVKYGATDFMSTDVQKGGKFAFDDCDGTISFSSNGFVNIHRFCDDVGGFVGGWIKIFKPVGVGAALTGIPGGVNAVVHQMSIK